MGAMRKIVAATREPQVMSGAGIVVRELVTSCRKGPHP